MDIKELSKDLSKIDLNNEFDNLKDSINKIEEMVNKYKNYDHLEMEFRLGFIEEDENNKEFNTDIGECFKEKIGKVLETCKEWSVKERIRIKDYIVNNKRLSIDPNGNKKCIRKEKLCKLDFRFEGTPFDIRVCFSQEIPITIEDFKKEKKNYYIRQKDRMSYKYKTWIFDITEVRLEDNTVETINCEVELECNLLESLESKSSKYIVHSSLLKVKDLINMCEKIENETKLIHLNTKIF